VPGQAAVRGEILFGGERSRFFGEDEQGLEGVGGALQLAVAEGGDLQFSVCLSVCLLGNCF
jgi:hypothetical protein